MNPNGQDRLPPLDLPKPQTEQLPQVSEALPYVNPSESISAKAVEQGIQPATNPAQLPVSLVSQDQPAQTATTQPILPLSGVPAIADDADLIEKEWVEKAKEIVGHTRSDPHAQNKELNKMKADYMKKRYNKDIKLQD